MRRNTILGAIIIILVIIVAIFYLHPISKQETTVTDGNVESGQKTITTDDNGKTITLTRGDRFLLKLGELQWTLSISNQNVISRVKNIMVVRGAQGIFTADNPGTTVISAEGRPICNPGEMCAQYIINWSATIIVK